MGSLVHLLWKASDSKWSNIEYLGGGEDWIDAEGFDEDCADFINQVIRRLESLGIEDTYLQEEWVAVQSASEDEARYCRTAAGLGWDPYALDEKKSRWIIALSGHADDFLTEALAVLDPAAPQDGWLAIGEALAEVKQARACAFERVRSLRPAVGASEEARDAAPWQAGYDWARRLRSGLGDEEAPLPEMAKLADILGEHHSALNEVVSAVPLVDNLPTVDGVVAQSDGVPALGLRKLGEAGKRFHLCRAVAEVLTGDRTDLLLTQATSPRQQRNRAFAAEFLVPSEALRNRIKAPVVDDDDIGELAEEFGVSSYVVAHQIQNHGLAQVEAALHLHDGAGSVGLGGP